MYVDNHLFFEALRSLEAGIEPFSAPAISINGQDCSIV